jgi:hypothetical protein
MRFLLLFTITLFHLSLFSQSNTQEKGRKGDFYLYWGWNITGYTNSTISFSGENYDFSLDKLQARHRPSPLDLEMYLSPTKFTIPQYNFRVGYFLNDTYNLSFGIDHMKYVMVSYQETTINGYIENIDPEFDGVYENSPIRITPQFLQFEHTDGLNYVNFELRRLDPLVNTGDFEINAVTGAGIGAIVPRTNVTLMNFDRYDEPNIAGYGLAAMAGLQFEMFRRFFIQFEAKAGYINLPNVRTTHNPNDRAKHDFGFLQVNAVMGVKLFGKKEK